MAPEHSRHPSVRIICHHHREGRFEDPVDLDACESLGPFALQYRREQGSLLLNVPPEGPPRLRVIDQNKIPGLAQPDTGGDVGGGQHALQYSRSEGSPVELASNVTASVDDLVEVSDWFFHWSRVRVMRPRAPRPAPGWPPIRFSRNRMHISWGDASAVIVAGARSRNGFHRRRMWMSTPWSSRISSLVVSHGRQPDRRR